MYIRNKDAGHLILYFFVLLMSWQRVKQLHLHGPNGLKGQLTTAIDLLTGSFMHQALAGAGPFTLFLMVDSAFSNLTQEEVTEMLSWFISGSTKINLIKVIKSVSGDQLHADFPFHLNSVMPINQPDVLS